ncbi:hypothetical protein Q0590_20045 [Rhodocytophaga aerolata]|uniref:ABC transporter permease n=1 Tax=Rhodocytophaga aerolata TaxID=455078 RepID=A0ABT8R9D9_9BACT|nr:hypothetical protein [Rhodocytophaga aerolata]MDO1448579.1 hypothetical protein [Rhodocytophaga aerolata]
MNNIFDIGRLTKFIQRQAVLNAPPILIAAGAIFGTMLIVSILTGYYGPENMEGLKGFFLFVFFLGGFILTSNIFAELHTPLKSYFYLTLPVSTAEKLIGSWILTSPVYVVVFSVIAYLIYLIPTIMVGNSYPVPAFFDHDTFQAIGSYMVIQTVFFLGAAYFRKYNFLKTVLSLFLFQIFIGLYAGLLFWLLFGGGNVNDRDFDNGFKGSIENTVPQLAHVFFWYILGPFLLVVSYFSLKEREV